MQKLTLLLFSLFIFNGFGQTLSEPVELLVQLNSAPHGEMENKCRGDQVEDPSEAKLQQCMVDLCGTVDQLDSVQLTDENFEEEMKKIDLSQFSYLKEDLDSMAEYYQEMNSLLIGDFEKRLKDKNSSLLKMAQGDGDLSDYGQYAQMTFEPYIFPQIDLKKPMKERLEIVVMPHGKGDKFDKAMQDFKEQHYQKMMNGSWTEKAMNGLFTTEEVFEEANEKISTLKRNLEDAFGGELPMDIEESFNDIQIFMDDRSLDPYPEDGQQLAFTLSYLEDTLKELRGEEVLTHRPTCQSGECLKFIKDKIKGIDLQKTINDYKVGNTKKFDSSETLKNCHDFILSQSFGSDKSVEEFKEKVPLIIENYKKNVLKKFSTETHKKFSNDFDKNLHLIFPDRTNRITKAGQIIDGNIGMAEGSLPVPESLTHSSDIMVYQWLDMVIDKEGKVDPYLPIKNVCQPGPHVTASDAFLPLKAIQEYPMMMFEMPQLNEYKSNVFISPFSCEHSHHGKDIFSHELSHYVSYLFSEEDGPSKESKNEYLEIRNCAKKVMVGATEGKSMPSAFEHPGDLRTSEEDTADILAFMAYPESRTPFTCTMLFKDPDGGYDLRLEGRENKGSHSFVPYRILHEAIQKKIPLSESCRGYLTQAKDDIEEVQCLK